MRCPNPSCGEDNPDTNLRCDVCGSLLVSPGRKLTSFETSGGRPGTLPNPGPPAPPAGPAGTGVPAGPAPAGFGMPPNAASLPPTALPPAGAPPLMPLPGVPTTGLPLDEPRPGPTKGRRTVVEQAPVLPPVPGMGGAPSLGSPGVAGPLQPGPAAPSPLGPLPGGLPGGLPLDPGIGTTKASPNAMTPGAPGARPPGAVAPVAVAAKPAPPLPAGAARMDPTQLVQSPDLGGAPQLRGALFEYRNLGHHGLIHTLRTGRNVLGRDPGICDVIIDDDRVSKQHAFLFIRNDEVSYLDISSNGSVVDGRTVHGTEAKLQNLSVIELGGSRLVFVVIPRRLVDGLP